MKPDFARRIDLPGAGPCPRPVDIDQARSGLSQLVSLRVYSFAQGVAIDGEAEDDEVFVALLRGSAVVAIDVGGERVGDYTVDSDGGARCVYLPPNAAYHLVAVSDCDIAYARVKPIGQPLPASRAFAPTGGRLKIAGYATGMDLSLAQPKAGASADLGDDAPERFVHVRSDDGGIVTIMGERLGDWETAVLARGEPATCDIEKGALDLLTITASAR